MLQTPEIAKHVRLALSGLTLFGVLATAQADVKLVSHIHTDQNGTTQPDVTVTTYYKGAIVRTESGATVTLLNTTTGKSAILHPWNKTFAVFNINQVAPTGGLAKDAKVDAHATVTQTNEHKVIAGKNTTKFVADVDFTVSSNLLVRHTVMHIVRWTTADVPMDISSDVLEKYSPEQLTFRGLSGIDDVQKELAKITGLPLSSEITIKSEFSAPQGVGGVPPPTTEMISSDVDSISQDSLDDSLFQVPTDYKSLGGGMNHLPGPGAGGG
jgi:hypothetical protein